MEIGGFLHYHCSALITITLPLEYPQLVFPPPINVLMFDRHGGQRGKPPDCAYAVNSFTRSISGTGRRESQNRTLANRACKLNGLSGNSSRRLLTCSNFSDLNPDCSAVVNSSDMFIDNCKVGKSLKKSSRRKAKKKGRQSKKLLCDTVYSEMEVPSGEYVHGSSKTETCHNNDMDHVDGFVSYSTVPEISLADDRLIKKNYDGNEYDDIFSSSESPKSCARSIDEMEKSEAVAPAVRNSVGEHALCNSENHLQTRNPEFSLNAGGVEDIHNIQICCFKDMCSKSSSNMQHSLVLDSVSLGSNSDVSTNAGEDVKQSEKTRSGIGLSEPPGFISRTGYIICQNLLNGVDNIYEQTEGTKHGAHSSRSSYRRGKQNEMVSRNASVNRFAGVVNLHGCMGKENNHSVWKKVQRNGFHECGSETKKVSSSFSQFDTTLKEAPSLKRNCNFVYVNTLSRVENKKDLKDKVSGKMKSRTSTGPKQEYNCYSRRGPQSNRANSNEHPNISMKQNEIPYISSHASGQQGVNRFLGSHAHNNCPMAGFMTSNVECVTFESVRSAQAYPDESESLRSVCCTVSSMNKQNIESMDSSLPKSCDSFDQAMPEEQSQLYVPHLLADEIGRTQRKASFTDLKQSQNSGSTLQKWIPVSVKDLGSAISRRSFSSSLEHSDETTAKDWTLKSTVEGKKFSSFQNLGSSLNSRNKCGSDFKEN
ncbi:Serine-rich adhesin for platelets like [Quillaja saponaria]|uniref:Serine-rich adhesin for platelets like n=1 Tax=Quillaja saponaria TaxID=32244 RepID=A0AAD7M545_QUISA|nr:Serine-rich adhesin for platelets like [Quillaja saponaria]